jgi:hypothetical protein
MVGSGSVTFGGHCGDAHGRTVIDGDGGEHHHGDDSPYYSVAGVGGIKTLYFAMNSYSNMCDPDGSCAQYRLLARACSL